MFSSEISTLGLISFRRSNATGEVGEKSFVSGKEKPAGLLVELSSFFRLLSGRTDGEGTLIADKLHRAGLFTDVAISLRKFSISEWLRVFLLAERVI